MPGMGMCGPHPRSAHARVPTEMVAQWHALDGFGKFAQAEVLPPRANR